MRDQVLIFLLLTAGGLALLHLGFLIVGRRPAVGFVATWSAASTAVGLVLLRDALLARGRAELWFGLGWAVVVAIGFFSAGVVAALTWLAAVRGTAFVLRRPWRER